MHFALIDRIVELNPGVSLTAIKTLTLAEEYLKDHFPLFPVMPGVLMLEAMTQASAWLVRASEDFAHSMVVLREAANVKYAQFLEPGQSLQVIAEMMDQGPGWAKVKARGNVEGRTIVSGRLVLAKYNIADTRPDSADADETVRDDLREQFALLCANAIIVRAKPAESAGSMVPGRVSL